MLEMKVSIIAVELAAAINNLACAIDHHAVCAQGRKDIDSPSSTVSESHPVTAPTQSTSDQISATASVDSAPIPVTQPASVPTAAPTYTLEMIASAGSALIDAGKLDQLMQLLRNFGVDSLTNLAPKDYGAVASELRALGAKI